MRIRSVAVAILALFAQMGLLPAGGAVQPQQAKKDLEALKGTWAIISAEKDGKNVTDTTVTLTFDGSGRATVKKGSQLIYAGTIKIDPTKKPKTLDLTQESEGEFKGKTILGIYEIEGNSLKICSGKNRPTQFSSKPGSGFFLRFYKRETK